MGKKLIVKSVNWRGMLSAEGLEVSLDDYATREEAEKELYDLVLQYVDYGIEEVEVEED